MLEHAIIAIIDRRSTSINEQDNKPSAFSGLKSMVSGVTNTIKAYAEAYVPQVSGLAEAFLDEVSADEGAKEFKVQFNPQTLSFQIRAQEQSDKKSEEQNRTEIVDNNPKTQMSMSVDLIFDDTDKNMSAKGNVKKVVEGFIAALMNERTRSVNFIWGKQKYVGTITGLNASYVMFDKDGNPVRATVKLSMNCIGPSWHAEADPSRSRWEKSYQTYMNTLEPISDTIMNFFS